MYTQMKSNKTKKGEQSKMENITEKNFSSINEALSDDKFLEKLRGVKSSVEIVRLFADEKGIKIDAADAQDAYDKLESLRNGEELTEEDLEIAAGGYFGRSISAYRPFGSSGGGANVHVRGYGPTGSWGISIAIRSWLRR